MSSSYTSSLRLVLPVQGELNNTWGDVVNAGLTNLTDSAIAGTATVSIADANTTLTSNNGAADQAREMFLSLTGSQSAGRNVICPSASKLYFATNGTTGGFATTLKTAGGTGIAIPAGRIMALYCDGTNVKDAVSYVSELQTPSLYSSGGATVVGNLTAGTLTTAGGITGASLSVSGGAVTGASNLPVLISSQTADSSATIDFTSGLTSTYKSYELRIIDYAPATDGTEIWLLVSQAASFLTSGYGYGTAYTNYVTANYVGGATSAAMMLMANGISSGSGYGLSGSVTIFNPAGTSKRKNIQWDLSQYNSSGVARYYGAGTYAGNNTAIDGLRIKSSSGNITSGTFELWGYP